MPTLRIDSDSESLSALSDVDESYLVPAKIKSEGSESPRAAKGRPKSLKTTGVDARDKTHGRTALHKASARGNLERMRDLIAVKGASIDITDNAGVTPLHDACTAGHVEAVRYLIQAGATVSPKDCEGDYPLLDAAQNDNQQICEILLEAGANPTMQNSSGMSALSEAEEGPLKDLLRQYSSRFDSPGQNRMRITDVLSADSTSRGEQPGKDSFRLRASRSSKLNIDSQGARRVDINGRDQLHQYVLQEDDDIIEQFLDIQDCDFQDHYGDTPLHAASRLGNAHICGLLLQHGAKVNMQNKKGNTALHEASYKKNSREVIVALLDAGASSLAANHDKEIPSDIAIRELGVLSTEARLLQQTVLKEREKAFDRERKRAVRKERNGSMSGSAKSTPVHSPKVPREREGNGTEQYAKDRPQQGINPDTNSLQPLSVPVPPAEIAITVATNAPPEIVSTTKQVVSSGLPATQFLTELKSNRFLGHIDSSIRGSPLPVVPKVSPALFNNRARSPTKSLFGQESPIKESAATPLSPNTLKRKTRVENGSAKATSPKRSKTQPSLPQVDVAAQINGTSAPKQDETAAAVAKMSRDIVAAIEKQNELLSSMLSSINALVAERRQ